MIYVQFYYNSVPHAFNQFKTYLIEACGDRGVIILDGRESQESHHSIAKEECIKRGYLGYRVMNGNSFIDSQPVSGIIHI